MITDIQGHALSGASQGAATAYEQAVAAFQIYRGDPMTRLDEAIAAAPAFAMAHLLKAHLLALATEPGAVAMAREVLGAVRQGMALDEREASHAAAIELVLQGEWTQAALALDRHGMQHPFDVVALQAGHLIDFYRGNARNLRDRIARVLPHWSSDMPAHSIVLGMHAFGLEECGDYARAEAVAREALAGQPLDSWAHHAVAHVMEMQGRAQDGIGWMRAREPQWSGEDNFFKVHNAWHGALCHLELGQAAEVLALYDGLIRAGRSAVVLDMVDASALLWRLHLSGVDVGDRWVELAQAWDAHADGVLYPFNDWHAVMAYLGADRPRDVQRLRDAMRGAGGATEVARWAADTGADLIEGFVAHWQGDHDTAVQRLYRARPIANRFGGSHAQRDIIDWTLTESALRGGQRGMAEALAHERLALRPHSPVNLGFLRRARGLAAGGAGRQRRERVVAAA
ncbi:MAG: tetratricopeptide repeat protein [Hydrogenophaga sp.]|uniref:tetratricopeptide repeat protein n=1 Tax=Hydrogenophaga sp. TaxID=1904254 RepID=UPI00262AF53C|nr:tetratricopeptide repeat protein [Hydrogenophaga sp.]MCV0440546.1 tetratricopeptide repeat protein [Hydrogenophaga sp.]